MHLHLCRCAGGEVYIGTGAGAGAGASIHIYYTYIHTYTYTCTSAPLHMHLHHSIVAPAVEPLLSNTLIEFPTTDMKSPGLKSRPSGCCRGPACEHGYTHMHTYIRVGVCVCAYLHICNHTHVYICIYHHTQTHTCMFVYMWTGVLLVCLPDELAPFLLLLCDFNRAALCANLFTTASTDLFFSWPQIFLFICK